MRNFVYGLVFGAIAVYLYATHGPLARGTLDSLLAWRDGSKASTAGYGGKAVAKR